MDYFAIFGSPLAHSLSPQIHQAFAEQFGIALRYEKIEASKEQFPKRLRDFHQQGGRGANVTFPLKNEAFKLCEVLSTSAKESEAVNTLFWNEQGLLQGDSTDGEGLVRDLIHNKNIALKGKRILILGLGGAAKSIILALMSLEVEVLVVNRTCQLTPLGSRSCGVRLFNYRNLPKNLPLFDLVINATSASLDGQLPPLDPYWIKSTVAIDLNYDLKRQTPFMRWAQENGAKKAYDGLGMLIEQAALSFELWYQKKPSTQPLFATLLGT